MPFYDEQNDACDCHAEDTERVDGGDGGGVGFRLIQGHDDDAQNAAEEVDSHMQQDCIFEIAGLHIDKGEKAAQEKGVKELVKVHVEQPEDQPGEYHGTAFSVL